MSLKFTDLTLTNYPNSVDEYNSSDQYKKIFINGQDYVLAEHMNSAQQMAIAIQRILGANPQGSFATVSERIQNAVDSIPTIAQQKIDENINNTIKPMILSHKHNGTAGNASKIDLVSEVTGKLNAANINTERNNPNALKANDIYVSSGNTVEQEINLKLDASSLSSLTVPIKTTQPIKTPKITTQRMVFLDAYNFDYSNYYFDSLFNSKYSALVYKKTSKINDIVFATIPLNFHSSNSYFLDVGKYVLTLTFYIYAPDYSTNSALQSQNLIKFTYKVNNQNVATKTYTYGDIINGDDNTISFTFDMKSEYMAQEWPCSILINLSNINTSYIFKVFSANIIPQHSAVL